MSRRRGKPTPPREWEPLRQTGAPNTDPLVAADYAARGLTVPDEVWENDRYVVIVRRSDEGHVGCLSIRRQDRKPARDWRNFQRIKNEVAGSDVEAVELYPADDRLVDSANQFWLWCLPPGTRFPLGFDERFVVDADADDRTPGSRQRALS